ncbi:hypothetical protein [Enterovibrio norvegicus]|uniref:hypothetical protein n=1 Tax=Enterovibrio norvegicus TaxID=188144 RepID=UPI000C8244F8|nr:hypothetical protein [Enterovibrio norvegicus]PMH69094.1 hypothetical protein BCU62_25365 [Enterovibrio norvegicus]
MINFLAIYLNTDGAIVRDKDTAEVMNIQLGEFNSKDIAIEQACRQLECSEVIGDVLMKGNDRGGFQVVDAQEFDAV